MRAAFGCKECINLGAGKYFFLAALSAGDGTAQRFGVAGIFVGCGGELILFLAGQNHDVVALWAFGHYGHVGFALYYAVLSRFLASLK
jgi:hypothetical protein